MKTRNPRSKKTYLEDPTPTGDKKKEIATKQVNTKSAKKPPKNAKKGRSIKVIDNPIFEELSHDMRHEIELHRVPRIYNTRSFCMFLGNMVRHIICCSR
jgi:hypothetical protein